MQSKIRNSLFEHLVERERCLLEPEIRQSAERLNQLLDDDFIEIAANGVIFDKQHVLDRLPSEVVPQFYNQHFQGRMLADDIAQLSYQAAFRRCARSEFSYSVRMSLWRRHGDDWKMVFHQGTPCLPFNIEMDD